MKLLALLICFQLLAMDVDAQRPAQSMEMRRLYDAAQQHEQREAWQDAEGAWRTVLRVAPDDAHALVNLGVVLNRQGKTNEATEVWAQAARLDPKLAGAHFNLGLLRVRAGNYAEALTPLRQTLRLEPKNEAARRALALALIGTERFQEATRELALLLARAPQDATLLELAAESFMRQRRYAEAQVVLTRRVKLPDPTPRHWAQLGDALDASSRTVEAAEAYAHAVRLAPDDTVTRYGYGYLLWKLYRYPEAERELSEVLRRNPADARAAWTLGDLYLTKGAREDIERALPLLEQAVRAYPNEFDTRFALGRALLVKGDASRAVSELRRAVEINDRIADGHYQLGRALIRAGNRIEGARELARARELKESNRAAEAEPRRAPGTIQQPPPK